MRLQTLIVETEKITENALMKSLRKFNVNYQFLGQDFDGEWSFREKMKMLVDCVGNYEIVLILDYRDIMLLDNEESILNTFLSFNKPIIFGRDILCYPDESLAKYYPSANYLNAGVFIGYGNDVKWMMETALNTYDYTDDQLLYTKIFLENQDRIGIDIENKLIYNCQLWASKTKETTIFDVQYDYKNKKIIHRKYNTIPKIIHTPGSSVLIRQAQKLL